MITPETCKHPDELCSECSSGAKCHPVIPRKDGAVKRVTAPRDKKRLPFWLADASPAVRRDYGY